MNSSFSFSRFGVKRPLSRARCAVCFGGSNETRCSLIGNWSRCASSSSVMSSPVMSKGNGKGPKDELTAEKVVLSRYTWISSSYPVTATTRLLGTCATGHCARRYS